MRKPVLVFPILFMATICLLMGCYRNVPYRTAPAKHPASAVYDPEPKDWPDCQPGGTREKCHPYYQAYIEFDEFGEMWDSKQLDMAVQQIDKASRKDAITCAGHSRPEPGPVKLVVFIHGWKNNDSEASGNVWGFRDELRHITDQHCQFPHPLPVVGVYIGWRGGVIKIPVVEDFTYWDRHRVSQELPGAHLTYALNRLTYAAKHVQSEPEKSRVIVIGHSFGGQVLERALTQSVLQVLEEHRASDGFKSPYDLVLFLNEAAPATESYQMMNYLDVNHVSLKSDVEGSGHELPLFVAMTSKGDAATGIALPIGQNIARITHSTHKYVQPNDPKPDPAARTSDPNHDPHANITNQATFYTHSTANIPALQSHTVELCPPGSDQAASPGVISFYKNHKQNANERYCIVRDPKAWNQTAYWVMQLPTEIVPDHTSVFGPELQELITRLIQYNTSTEQAPNPTLQMKPN